MSISQLEALWWLLWDPLLIKQTGLNIRGTFLHPKNSITPEDEWRKTAILIPWFLCNPGMMTVLWDKLSSSMNVVYPDISAVDYMKYGLVELADKIVRSIESYGNLNDCILIWHSAWGILALLVAHKLAIGHVMQISTPNAPPVVATIAWLGYIPAVLDLRNLDDNKDGVLSLRNIWSSIHRLTTVIPSGDRFIGTNCQWYWHLKSLWFHIGNPINRTVLWWHMTPILTDKWVDQVIDILLRNP